MSNVILDQIRTHIRACGKSRYQISQSTGVDQATLCRIMAGGSCKVETAEVLCEHFGLELVPKTCLERSRKKRERKAGGQK